MMKFPALTLILFKIASVAIILLLPQLSYAAEKTVELKINKGITATASYSKGDTDKPAVLLIHGFLITREHATLKNLSLAISDEGYTTLAPTLSLDIDRRKQSLPCEAIHTHTMQKDNHEIKLWIDWLQQQGHTNIILLGHSFGSLNMIIQLSNSSNKIKHAIATSLVNIENALYKKNVSQQIKRARQQFKADKKSLGEYHISYCEKYVSTAESFISYAEWNKQKILSLLKKVKTPLHIILGSSDKRIETSWPDILKKHGKKVSLIQGANHFFSNEYEFELHDVVLGILNDL